MNYLKQTRFLSLIQKNYFKYYQKSIILAQKVTFSIGSPTLNLVPYFLWIYYNTIYTYLQSFFSQKCSSICCKIDYGHRKVYIQKCTFTSKSEQQENVLKPTKLKIPNKIKCLWGRMPDALVCRASTEPFQNTIFPLKQW